MLTHDTQMFKDILQTNNLNRNNAHLFVHAYNANENFDEMSCFSYFANGIYLKNGVKSILSTIQPLEKNKPYENSLVKPFIRGNHKIIVAIPYELDGMFLGSTLNGSGDAGNQYKKRHLIDFLISEKGLSAIPKEFIVGAYITDDFSETNPQETIYIPNIYFYGNEFSDSNIKSLKKTLFNACENLIGDNKDLVGYCLGMNNINETELNIMIERMKRYGFNDDINLLLPVVEEKMQKEQSKQQNPSQPS